MDEPDYLVSVYGDSSLPCRLTKSPGLAYEFLKKGELPSQDSLAVMVNLDFFESLENSQWDEFTRSIVDGNPDSIYLLYSQGGVGHLNCDPWRYVSSQLTDFQLAGFIEKNIQHIGSSDDIDESVSRFNGSI